MEGNDNMIKEGLYRVYLEFVVVAKDSSEANETVKFTVLSPNDEVDFDTELMLSVEATEEAISFMTQMTETNVDEDQMEPVMISYLKAKGLKERPYLFYKDVIDALRRAIEDRKGGHYEDEED